MFSQVFFRFICMVTVYFTGTASAFAAAGNEERVWWITSVVILAGFALVSATSIIVLMRLNKKLRQEIAERIRVETELHHLADHDMLSTLLNRRAFSKFWDKELNRCKRYQQKLSLILLDIDKFKSINDKYGHKVGDEAIKQVANILKTLCRDSDTLARYGGEEFIILLPNAAKSEAEALAERLRTKIEKSTLRIFEEQTLRITASFGVCECDIENDTLDSIFTRADKYLYIAKRTGRNKVISREDQVPMAQLD